MDGGAADILAGTGANISPSLLEKIFFAFQDIYFVRTARGGQ